MNNQTAIEWLKGRLPSLFEHDESGFYTNLFEQALAIEEDQMINFAEFVATYPDKNRNYKGEILHAKSKYDGSERTLDLLEIYKTK
jgi:hypothetical protein